MDTVISCEKVSFGYDEVQVLCDATFNVSRGEFIGVIGPNGGGKTTLLKLILGFFSPDSGFLKLFGGEPKANLNRVAYVPQNLRYDKKFPISVFELVLSGLLSKLPWYGRYLNKHKQKAHETLKMLKLDGLENRSLGTLSGGQVQRALIARALVSDPELLILDEPTANVDAEAETEIYALLKSLAGKMTIIMVTHDLTASIKLVDRVVCVQNTVTTFKASEVCEHFALGLYHAPLLVKSNVDETCCQLQVPSEKEEENR
ncbi:MAG: ABC transporter ATP-binding protein [Chlamydiota bacterium]|nr:ABC transporter ATP-binding protein [Chlamydiota bacterium]